MSLHRTTRNVRGRPLLLDEELDLRLRTMIVTLQTADAGINVYVVRSVSNGLVGTNPKKFDRYIDFQKSRSWVR